MLNLNESQVAQLEQFIQELPTKFGLPLLNLLRSFSEKKAESKPEQPKEKILVEAE